MSKKNAVLPLLLLVALTSFSVASVSAGNKNGPRGGGGGATLTVSPGVFNGVTYTYTFTLTGAHNIMGFDLIDWGAPVYSTYFAGLVSTPAPGWYGQIIPWQTPPWYHATWLATSKYSGSVTFTLYTTTTGFQVQWATVTSYQSINPQTFNYGTGGMLTLN